MSRRSAGLVGVWAEMQRQQQRQMEAEARQRREEARQARAYQRLAAQGHREFRQTEARRRTEVPAGAEVGQLEVSDGRPGETALVLGSFRHRPNGDWDFVLGGKGYARGLEQLLQDYGIEVE